MEVTAGLRVEVAEGLGEGVAVGLGEGVAVGAAEEQLQSVSAGQSGLRQ